MISIYLASFVCRQMSGLLAANPDGWKAVNPDAFLA
jgi:hypothetical protein